MENLFEQAWEILKAIVVNFQKPEVWQSTLGQPEVFWPAVLALAFVVFAETGLLFGFFLPGDSLLVTVGIVAHLSGWDIWPLLLAMATAAIVGDSCGYFVGAKAGPPIFNRPNSRFFKRDHLLAAKAFYERHGGKTIVIAKFMPFVRTFAPVVAGAAGMRYRTYLFYSIFGGIGWVTSMLLFGFTAHLWLNPLGQAAFGNHFRVEKNIDILVVFIIAVSVAPMVIKGFLGWRAKRKGPPVIAGSPGTPAA
jgi:membrane-associated protein